MEVVKLEQSYSFQRSGTVTMTAGLPVNWICSFHVIEQMVLKLSVDSAKNLEIAKEDFRNSRTFIKFSAKQGTGAPKTLIYAFLADADNNIFVFDFIGAINPIINMVITSYRPKTDDVRFPRGLGLMDPKISKPQMNFGNEAAEFDFASPNIQHDRILDLVGKKFHVQSGYLIMWSDYFNTLFNGEFIEAYLVEIKIEDVLPKNFEIFLKFIYPCQLEITAHNYLSLISMGYRFMAPRVLEKCQEFIATYFDELDKLELIELAFKFNIQEIKDEVANYLESNAVSKAKTEYLLDRNSFVINNRDRIAQLSPDAQIFIFQSVLNTVKLT